MLADPMLQLFGYAHLPAEKQTISKQFHDLAVSMVNALPRNPERTAMLRLLRQAKDAAVTAQMWKEDA